MIHQIVPSVAAMLRRRRNQTLPQSHSLHWRLKALQFWCCKHGNLAIIASNRIMTMIAMKAGAGVVGQRYLPGERRNSQWSLGPRSTSEIGGPVRPRYAIGTSEFGMELGAKFHQRNRSSNGSTIYAREISEVGMELGAKLHQRLQNSTGSQICPWNFKILNGTWGQVPPAKLEFQWVADIPIEFRNLE